MSFGMSGSRRCVGVNSGRPGRDGHSWGKEKEYEQSAMRADSEGLKSCFRALWDLDELSGAKESSGEPAGADFSSMAKRR